MCARHLTGRIRKALMAILGTVGADQSMAADVPAAVNITGMVHFDAHTDTWDGYFGGFKYTHGTPVRRAIEEGLLLKEHSVHVGIRGSLYAASDLSDDEELGFTIVHAREFHTSAFLDIIERVNRRVGDAPLYVSIDIDVLDPAHAPGTGTPEAGGLTSRELLELLRGLTTPNLVGADIVEVAPAYDHASITAVAAAHCAFDLMSIMSKQVSA